MAITKKDLQQEISRLNKKYCRSSKNYLKIDQAYGGYEIQLTGKRTKNGKLYKNSMGSGACNITYGYKTARETLADLYKNDSKGWVRSTIKSHNKK